MARKTASSRRKPKLAKAPKSSVPGVASSGGATTEETATSSSSSSSKTQHTTTHEPDCQCLLRKQGLFLPPSMLALSDENEQGKA
jgi:hypothetical protein